MPKFLQIADFAKAGLNSDLLAWDLPGSFLTDIRNIRIIRNKLSPFGGHQKWVEVPSDQPGHILHVGSLSSDFWMLPGKNEVSVWDSVDFFEVTVLGGFGTIDEDLWTSCMLSKIPIINNPDNYPQYWPIQSGAALMEYLPWDETRTWAEAFQSCRIIRSHKQFLFALDIVDNGQEITDGVRWSAPADIGGVPPTWDHLDITNVAGLTHLGGAGGDIIDGLSLRDAFCVYRERGISVFDYIGGQFVWQIRHLSDTIGLVSKDAIVEVKGAHFLIGDGDILVNDGNSLKSLMHNRIRKRFVSDYDADNFRNSFAVKNNIASEVWFCIPSSGSVYPTLAYIYNWRDDTWAIRDLPNVPFANFGEQSSPSLTWDSVAEDWDNSTGAWNQRQITPLDDTIVGIIKGEGSSPAELIFLDKGISDSPYNSVIERTGFALEGLNKVTTITKIYPHIQGSQEVDIQVGSQEFPGAPVLWKPLVHFNPEKDRKVDVRTTGELHCFRITATGSSANWDLSGIDIEYVEAGYR